MSDRQSIDLSPEALEALPSLDDLHVPAEIQEAAAVFCASPDSAGLERGPLEVLLRLLAFHLRLAWKVECDRAQRPYDS